MTGVQTCVFRSQPLYFARGDTRRPFHFALAAMVINAAIAIGLAPLVGWIAPALATTVAGWAMLGLLYWGLRWASRCGSQASC